MILPLGDDLGEPVGEPISEARRAELQALANYVAQVRAGKRLRTYVPKMPVTEEDFAAVERAQAKRDRRAARR